MEPEGRILRGGALAIDHGTIVELGDRIGSIEKGKRADIIVIGLDAPHLAPLHDLYAQLVYALGREDVRTVLIDGKVVMRNRVPTTIDPGECLAELTRLSAQMEAGQGGELTCILSLRPSAAKRAFFNAKPWTDT